MKPTTRIRLFALAGLVCALLACAGERERDHKLGTDERSVTTLPEANGRELPALGEELLIALAQAKNFHHKADIYLQEGDFDNALDSVRQILSIRFPEGAPEAEDVTLDARARLAKLLVAKGEVDEAMNVVQEGIAGATRRSFFLANLYTVKGEVHEAMANLLDDDNNGDGDETPEAKLKANAARRSAIEALDRSIEINTELQKALMGEDTP